MEELITPEIIELSHDNNPISPLTPHNVEPKDGSLMGSSTGRTNTSSSGGKAIPLYLRASGGKVIPRYLRASTGSCHDICKYGGHHAFEEKEKHPILKGRKIILKEDQSPVESVSLKTRKKMSMVKLSSPCDQESQSCDTSETKKKESKFVKQTSVSPAKKLKDGVKSSVEFKPKSVTKKSSPSPLSSPRDQSVRRNTDAKTSKSDFSNTAQKKDPVSKIVTERSPASPLNPHRDRSARRDTNVKTGKNSDSPKSTPKKMVSKRTENSPPSPFNSPGDRHVRRDSNGKTCKNSEGSKIGQKKELRLLKTSSYPKPSFNRSTSVKARKYQVLKGVSPPKKASKGRNDEHELFIDEHVTEKILYVIEPESENKSSELGLIGDESLVSSLSRSSPPSLIVHEDDNRSSEYDETETDSEYSDVETDSEDDETDHQSHLEPSKENYRRSRRASTVYTENNDPGHKLKFRRGRVVDPESVNNEPRRLKFRKARGLGDNQNGKGEVRRKSFKRRENSDGATPGKPEEGKVMLRHQDVDGKKDGQGLFNNVIEETASKLAETRKSKVKALVGAFETVISLQEKRPSTTSSG